MPFETFDVYIVTDLENIIIFLSVFKLFYDIVSGFTAALHIVSSLLHS